MTHVKIVRTPNEINMIRIIALVVTLAIVSCSTDNIESTKMKARVVAAERVINFIKTADTTSLRTVFADSLLQLMSIEQMLVERSGLIDLCGQIKKVEGPFIDSSAEIRVSVVFEQKALDVWLSFNSEERVNSMDITNAPISDSSFSNADERPNDLGNLTDLGSMGAIASQFNADTGFVRLVALLSPT